MLLTYTSTLSPSPQSMTVNAACSKSLPQLVRFGKISKAMLCHALIKFELFEVYK